VMGSRHDSRPAPGGWGIAWGRSLTGQTGSRAVRYRTSSGTSLGARERSSCLAADTNRPAKRTQAGWSPRPPAPGRGRDSSPRLAQRGHCSGPPSQRRRVVDPGGMCPRPSECLLGLDRVECDRTAQQQFAHNTRRGAARPRRGRRGTWSCAVGRSGGAASSATITPSTSSTQTSTRLRHRSRPAYNMAKGTSSVRAHR
jgi:hypothetical protein